MLLCTRTCTAIAQRLLLRTHRPTVNTYYRAMSATNIHDTTFSSPDIKKFLQDFHNLVVEDGLAMEQKPETKVVNFQQPEQLQKLLDIELQHHAEPNEKILDLCRDIIKYSVKTGHPRFYNQLYSGKDPYSLVGAWLTDALSTNLHTYEVAPVFVVLEKYMVQKVCNIMGYADGDGVFCPGGSFSNILALHAARYKNNPDVKQKGIFGSTPMTLFSHTDSHYSLSKGASFLGFGVDNVIKVKTTEIGSMDTEDLDRCITEQKNKGSTPLFVMATSGTTVLGSFDNLNAVADVCEKHGVWMHVDAAWGGSVMLSKTHKHLMNGVDRADSIAWNPHKMSGVPIQCSMLLMKNKGLLEQCNSYKAEYLFQPDKCYDTSFDVGDKTIQCGRRVDAVKIWMMWKAYGDEGMTERVERAYSNADYLIKQLEKTEGFRLVIPKFQCTNISFWYIPPRLRNKEETADWWKEVGKVAPTIKGRMMLDGTMMIGYQPMTTKGYVNFFRIIIENPLTDTKELDFVLQEIERLGKDL